MVQATSRQCVYDRPGGAVAVSRGKRYRTLRAPQWGVRCSASSEQATVLASFPEDYTEAIKQAQQGVAQALEDGHKLIEVEFPSASLASVPGDAEGANEMTYSLGFLRKFLRVVQDRASAVRVFFPDEKELEIGRHGLGKAAPAGHDGEAVFGTETSFQLDFLTQPTGLLDLGLDVRKVDVASKVAPSDEVLVIAYPHFNVNEMIAVNEMWQGAAQERGIPIIVFNGELDRIRSGYYPPLFYPKIGQLAKDFLPLFETAYYVHNFKGAQGGALFRVYPEPWQVFRRDQEGMRLVHTQDTMPSLKEVALNILPGRH